MNRTPYNTRPNPRPQPQATQPQKKTPAFEAGPVRLVDSAGSLRAYVSVKIGPLTIHDFRVIQQGHGTPTEQEPWVSVPMKAWNTPEGERKFAALLELPPDWKAPLTAAVIAAWRDELQNTGGLA